LRKKADLVTVEHTIMENYAVAWELSNAETNTAFRALPV